ncbi:hypothetical protein IAS59_003606 [Cryptococcus gattii]
MSSSARLATCGVASSAASRKNSKRGHYQALMLPCSERGGVPNNSPFRLHYVNLCEPLLGVFMLIITDDPASDLFRPPFSTYLVQHPISLQLRIMGCKVNLRPHILICGVHQEENSNGDRRKDVPFTFIP